MTDNALADLITRLEKATGPDRELDLAISAAINYRDAFGTHAWKWSVGGDEIVSKTGGFLDPRQFVPGWTRSVDVALMLAPNWSWRVGNLPSGRGFAALGTQKSMQCIEGATPAIALCIAALKARAAKPAEASAS